MDTDLDTLAVALYVRIDDTLRDRPDLVPWRPKVGIAPKLSDAELLTLAVLQVLLGFDEEARWARHARKHLAHLFPYVPGQAGYNKRLRKSTSMLATMIRLLGRDTDVWNDDTWLIDSTPVECGRSRPTAKRSNLAGWAGYGYCASHSRFFWGLRLHLVATPAGLPVTFALTNPKIDERDVALDMFDDEGVWVLRRPRGRRPNRRCRNRSRQHQKAGGDRPFAPEGRAQTDHRRLRECHGPVMANVHPWACMLTKKVLPSGEKHAPANSPPPGGLCANR